LEKNGQC